MFSPSPYNTDINFSISIFMSLVRNCVRALKLRTPVLTLNPNTIYPGPLVLRGSPPLRPMSAEGPGLGLCGAGESFMGQEIVTFITRLMMSLGEMGPSENLFLPLDIIIRQLILAKYRLEK